MNRAPFTPITASDLKVEKEQSTLPIILITKGKILRENMKLASVDEEFIKKEIIKVGIDNLKDILILTINNNGKIYVQPRNGVFKTIETGFTGGNW